jgi:integrase
MILFGLYTGQRLGDIATLRWNNLDVGRGELLLSTRKTGKGNSIHFWESASQASKFFFILAALKSTPPRESQSNRHCGNAV